MVATWNRWLVPMVVVLGLLAAPACTRPPGTAGFVHREGRILVEGDGVPIVLRGVNTGQWFLWEQWLMGAAISTVGERTIAANLRTLVGTARADQFVESLRDVFITRADLDAIAALGFNVIRVPFNHTLLEDDTAPGVFKASGWARLDRLLDDAEAAGLYVVPDLHSAPCGQSRLMPSDPDATLLWSSPSCQDRTVAIWRAIAARYADRTIVAGWDLLNEPATPSPASALPALYRRIIDAIRSVDPNHLVITEGGQYGTNFSMLNGRLDENQAHSFHQYLWGTPDVAATTAATKAVAARDDLPLWLGEFGHDTTANVAWMVDRFNADPDVVGWAGWTWKGVPPSNATSAVRRIDPGPNWLKVINWLDHPTRAPRPTAAEAEAGLRDFVAASEFGATTPDEGFVDALGPVATRVRSDLDATACLHPGTGGREADTALELGSCDGDGAPPVWTRRALAPTPLRFLGRCIEATDDSTAATVRLRPCNGGPHWTLDPADGTIRAAGRCLTDPSATGSRGTALGLADCDGRPGQRWHLA